MNFMKLSQQIKAGKYAGHLYTQLPGSVQGILHAMSKEDISKKLWQISQPPITLNSELEQSLHQFRFSAAWLNIFEELSLPPDAALMEIAAGDIIYIAQALDAYAGEKGRYVSFNLNKELTRNFYRKAAALRPGIRIIEDNALNASKYVDGEFFDVIAFHHAVNDIIQTIVADADGIDTVNCNWWEAEPQMLRAVLRHHNAGTLKSIAYPDFIRMIAVCKGVLKPGGIMIFDNCSFMGYERMGYSTEFHSAYIDLARQWIREADLGLTEIALDDYDPEWWMIFQKG